MFSDEIRSVLKKRTSVHPEDYARRDMYWKEETDLLSRNLAETIQFIDQEGTDEEIYWLSEVFDEVIEKTQSHELHDHLRARSEKIVDAEQKRSTMYEVEDSLYYFKE